jgi:hypothetical protein
VLTCSLNRGGVEGGVPPHGEVLRTIQHGPRRDAKGGGVLYLAVDRGDGDGAG